MPQMVQEFVTVSLSFSLRLSTSVSLARHTCPFLSFSLPRSLALSPHLAHTRTPIYVIIPLAEDCRGLSGASKAWRASAGLHEAPRARAPGPGRATGPQGLCRRSFCLEKRHRDQMQKDREREGESPRQTSGQRQRKKEREREERHGVPLNPGACVCVCVGRRLHIVRNNFYFPFAYICGGGGGGGGLGFLCTPMLPSTKRACMSAPGVLRGQQMSNTTRGRHAHRDTQTNA